MKTLLTATAATVTLTSVLGAGTVHATVHDAVRAPRDRVVVHDAHGDVRGTPRGNARIDIDRVDYRIGHEGNRIKFRVAFVRPPVLRDMNYTIRTRFTDQAGNDYLWVVRDTDPHRVPDLALYAVDGQTRTEIGYASYYYLKNSSLQVVGSTMPVAALTNRGATQLDHFTMTVRKNGTERRDGTRPVGPLSLTAP